MVCAACGGKRLEPHLRVAGDAGADGLIPTTDRFGTALADIVRCRDCSHMQLERFPPEEDLSDAYAEAESTAYVEEEAGQWETARAILDEIEAQVEPGALLDLGSWVGFFLAEAQARGWAAVGVEPSLYASRFARERLGLDVHQAGMFDAAVDGGTFDAVFMGDVIEHLPRAGEALDRIAELLAPSGVLAMALPNAGSRLARRMGRRWWSVIPTHVHYFTPQSMRTMLERHGYEVVRITSAPKTFTVGYYLGRLGGFSDRLGRGAMRAARVVGLADRLWTPDFRDRMLVIARRNR